MIYAVGDVHGEADALRELLAKLPVTPSDLVVFLGDLINRGPDSFQCVEQVLAFDKCRKVAIQGNHEEVMQLFLEAGDLQSLRAMGGDPTLASYTRAGHPLTAGLPETHARFYAQAEAWTLPFYITADYIFTHAGWNLGLPLERQSPEAMRWAGVKGFESSVWTQTVIRGHTPFPKVTFARQKHYIGVDTGCGIGGFLSAVALPSGEVFTARPRSFRPRWYFEMRS